MSNAASIRQALENAILNGDHPPGSKLDLDKLAQQFECSRTPIRDVLHQLEASGLVRVAPKRGTFVTLWTFEQITERFEVMAEIEAACARLAARRISDVELNDLSAAQEACRQAAAAGDPEAYYLVNTDFHRCLYNATHNSFLVAEATRLNTMLQPYRRLQLRSRRRLATSLAEHQEILDAIRAGDAESAARATHAHIVVQGDRFHDLVAAMAAEANSKRA
ncbi:transcriptional regulator, GntR family [Devosia lucknowensis]|uniref:Transcriptional regulator, GntR family n=1 Tax=Devosia lucknowensis TaxID=1096929 RepID=A0A1Y6G6S9_9HYPH|nr:GntR family transcriptional regulator [Devosia lucknowensis]SMQ85464.1 transcriptional regulator, GntR family [Devosia lucknowensis]